MADEQPSSGMLSKVLLGLGQTWPARLAESAYNAVTLPGDVYAGRVDPLSDEAIARSADLAGMTTLGAGAIPSTAGELRAGVKLIKDNAVMPDNMQGYSIVSDVGTPLARVIGRAEGDTLHIDNIYTKQNPALFGDKTRVAQEQANTVSPAILWQALQQYIAENPGITKISGDRISGARFGGVYQPNGAGPKVTIPIPQSRLTEK